MQKGGDTMADCLFCKIAAGEIPSNKLYEDDTLLAFYDIDPRLRCISSSFPSSTSSPPPL